MTLIIKLSKDTKEQILSTLKGNKRVQITGIGSLRTREVKAKKLYHNFSKKVITIKKYKKVHFTPSLKLKNPIKYDK